VWSTVGKLAGFDHQNRPSLDRERTSLGDSWSRRLGLGNHTSLEIRDYRRSSEHGVHAGAGGQVLRLEEGVVGPGHGHGHEHEPLGSPEAGRLRVNPGREAGGAAWGNSSALRHAYGLSTHGSDGNGNEPSN
jgi:hypothetical protein